MNKILFGDQIESSIFLLDPHCNSLELIYSSATIDFLLFSQQCVHLIETQIDFVLYVHGIEVVPHLHGVLSLDKTVGHRRTTLYSV